MPLAFHTWLKPRLQHHRVRHEGVLGTALELQLLADNPRSARTGEAAALAEIERLEGIFSSFLPTSELSRWQAQGRAVVSLELRNLLREAESWMAHTYGAFNPAVAAVQALYRQNPRPSEAERSALQTALQGPLWRLEGRVAHKLTPLPLTFNALAKGQIADRAAQAALGAGRQAVLVNLGGDLRHIGPQGVRVAVTHPFHPADNAPPLAWLEICNQGVATSGHTWRGQHLFDPRSARPVAQIAQATVVAPSAAVADVLSTTFCVLEPMLSLALAEVFGVGCLLVEASGQTHSNPRFEQQRIR
ncbi:MAG: FAD:protein FMN transferase [Meiothermus sp.]|uniref:FAD:protein FMN transferase n=1 Tax=Meiothermus sp. TaxID=1955249 RepID=UPI0025CFAD1E|nr:FAD:protein FMN transferase [Meiothermus sp.]MCS7067974.1 FAD:protein FMN transferase [Meiothermus sp.]MDW8425582.1 FAD:protein FMN transferase [Meiothermus sp.]